MPDIQKENFDLRESARAARLEYLMQRSVSTGNAEIDGVLEGGLENGNVYLVMGPAKGGKSSFIRCLGIQLAKQHNVLYINLEQTGRNIIGKLYTMIYGVSFREDVHTRAEEADVNIESLPTMPFHIAFWPEKLESKAFDTMIRKNILDSINYIVEKDPEHRKPVIILENLSDTYCDRVNPGDSLTNIVTRTAQEIKNFCVFNNISMFLSHHTAKMQGDVPTLDDVRDSKRVVDLAHSIFATYVVVENDPITNQPRNKYRLRYIAGRGQAESKSWDVKIQGIKMELIPLSYTPEPPKKNKNVNY